MDRPLKPGQPAIPASLAELCAGATLESVDRLVPDAIAALSREFGAPRDAALARAFLRRHAPAGRILIYGAGTLAAAILPALEARADIEILGFIDRRAESLTTFEGRPVLPLEAVAAAAFDYILLCHVDREAEMAGRLDGLGIRPERILRIFGHPAFRQGVEARPRAVAPASQRVDACLISTTGKLWSIIPHRELARIFPPDRTINLFYGRFAQHGGSYADDVFRLEDCRQSVDVLTERLLALDPRAVYLKTTAHNAGEYLSYVVRTALPAATLVVEPYDLSGVMTTRRLKLSYGYSDDDLYHARLGNLHAFKAADLMVSKNGGRQWQALVDEGSTPHGVYFPNVVPAGATFGEAAAAGAPCRVVFAGTLSTLKRLNGRLEHPDLNYLDYFRPLVAGGGVTVDIFNAAHAHDPASDIVFSEYLDEFGGPDGAIRYHRRLRLEELERRLGGFHYGWLVSHDDDPSVIEPISVIGICNKFSTYVCAGLPVIMDRAFSFMAGLVERFGAGIVVSWEDRFAIADRLAAADHAELRRGVRRLAGFMAECNRATLQQLSRVIGSPTA